MDDSSSEDELAIAHDDSFGSGDMQQLPESEVSLCTENYFCSINSEMSHPQRTIIVSKNPRTIMPH